MRRSSAINWLIVLAVLLLATAALAQTAGTVTHLSGSLVVKKANDDMLISLIKGGSRSVTGLLGKRNPAKEKMNTLTATIGIRGTHFGLPMYQNDCGNIPRISGKPPENGLPIDVAAGAIQMSNQAGQQIISAGPFGFVGSIATPPIGKHNGASPCVVQ
ncbi:hypothetical protein GALL_217630 [mine drainage metagenome]|uniref:Uncharacterized protein n=1 Tax=mine drainage metagenome TaxID=410659 RepID=A0A1J5RJK5_9ZZZZ